MARAVGARAQVALAYESTYGIAPVSGYFQMPFASATLGMSQPLIDSELLGYGRDPLAPQRDAVTADGNAVVPIDSDGIGHWLKLLFGQPVTTGTTPKTHTYNSGSWTLPSASIEIGNPEVPDFRMYSGVMADTLDFTMQRSGLLQATIGLIAQGELANVATQAGTPAAIALQRFGHFNGSIKRNTVLLGNIVSGQVTYSNNLDRVETVRSDGKIEGLQVGMASMKGKIVSRFADTVLKTQALNGQACDLEFNWTIGANASLKLTAHAVYLPVPKVEISGPQGIQAEFDWMGALAVSPARMCTAVLVNTVASY